MIIYLYTNKINGKMYVGQTCVPLKQRHYGHMANARRGGCSLLGKALLKYGEQSFDIQELAKAFSQKQLDDLEVLWTVSLGTLVPNGYNIRLGPSRSAPAPRKPHSEEHIRKLREASRKMWENPELRSRMLVKQTFERRLSVSKALQGRPGPNRGRKFSSEAVERMKKSQANRPRDCQGRLLRMDRSLISNKYRRSLEIRGLS